MLATKVIVAAGSCVLGLGVIARTGEMLSTAPSAQIQAEKRKERWVSLFNGRDLTGWYTFLQKHGKDRDPDHVITIEENAIHLYKGTPEGSQVVMGYIGTQKEYGNYH